MTLEKPSNSLRARLRASATMAREWGKISLANELDEAADALKRSGHFECDSCGKSSELAHAFVHCADCVVVQGEEDEKREARVRELEAERDNARRGWDTAANVGRLEAEIKRLTSLAADSGEKLKTLAKIALGYIAFPVPAQEHALRETAEAALASQTPAAQTDDDVARRNGEEDAKAGRPAVSFYLPYYEAYCEALARKVHPPSDAVAGQSKEEP